MSSGSAQNTPLFSGILGGGLGGKCTHTPGQERWQNCPSHLQLHPPLSLCFRGHPLPPLLFLKAEGVREAAPGRSCESRGSCTWPPQPSEGLLEAENQHFQFLTKNWKHYFWTPEGLGRPLQTAERLRMPWDGGSRHRGGTSRWGPPWRCDPGCQPPPPRMQLSLFLMFSLLQKQQVCQAPDMPTVGLVCLSQVVQACLKRKTQHHPNRKGGPLSENIL